MRAARAVMATLGAAVVAMTLTAGASPAAAPCRPGPGASCARADLDGARLQKRNLTGVILTRASLVGARLQGSSLVGADLSRANLSRANLTGADLRGADLSRARLRGATLRKARLGRRGATAGRGSRIAGIPCLKLCTGDLRLADFAGADLSGAVFMQVDLRQTDLRTATLTGAIFAKADLRTAKLDGVNLAGARIQGADLRGASLAGANMKGAEITGTDLRGAVLKGADLSFVRFSADTDLWGVDMNGVDLRGADLSKAKIHPATLHGAKLEGAILPGSLVVRTAITSPRAFSAKLTKGGLTTTCTDVTACEGVGAPNAASTLVVTTSWAGFAFCPDGPVRLTSTDGGATYTGTCTYTASQSMTIRLRENRRITVRVRDLVGDPATIDRVAFEWRAPPTYDLVEATHECTGITACIGEYADGTTVRVLITGSGPYHVPGTASCQGGSPVGDDTMVSAPPWELTCLVDGDGHPLQLTADRELVVTLS